MIGAILSAVLPLAGDLLKRFIPDPEAQAKAQAEFTTMLMQMDLSQLAVNKAEAQSDGNFKGGWRPAIGWACAFALVLQFVLGPLLEWASAIVGHPVPPFPKFDDMLWELMFGMLGMGALRSFDKWQTRKK